MLWTPAKHAHFPPVYRSFVVTLLLLRTRSASPLSVPPRVLIGMSTPGAKAPVAWPVLMIEASSAASSATVVGRVSGSPPIWKSASVLVSGS